MRRTEIEFRRRPRPPTNSCAAPRSPDFTPSHIPATDGETDGWRDGRTDTHPDFPLPPSLPFPFSVGRSFIRIM